MKFSFRLQTLVVLKVTHEVKWRIYVFSKIVSLRQSTKYLNDCSDGILKSMEKPLWVLLCVLQEKKGEYKNYFF